MSGPAITVENLGKRYTIGHERRPDTLRDTLAHGARGLWRRWFAGQRSAEREDFWALRDVSFEVPRGEVVGIIGRNGAGKSTLLKILSRITEPTTGRAVIRGRVASLLEVGTGFHPELTGRENIFLNGAILGMSRAEIARKFDEIVAFAEVERFLDTPVKHYSSGMYVRLAFAVAAHLEPEILIVDEVLAVGDAAFQKKCLGKMQDVARGQGRTVLLVSHNLPTIAQLCPHAILFVNGRIAASGATPGVMARYHPASDGEGAGNSLVRVDTGALRATMPALVSSRAGDVAVAGEEVALAIDYELLRPSLAGRRASVSLTLHWSELRVVNLWTDYKDGQQFLLQPRGRWTCRIPRWPFRSGSIRADLYVEVDGQNVLWRENTLTFRSQDGPFYGPGRLPNADQGILFLEHHWE